MPQKTPLSIFFLGKGRESLRLQTLLKKLSRSALSALPPARKNIFDSDTVWTMHAKIDQNKFTFSQISHLSSNRRVRNLTFYFQFTNPAREFTHRMKFEYPERHEFRKHHVSSLLEPEKCQKFYPERHEFRQHHNSSLP